MIMTAAALTDDQRADLPRALKGNICRCTGYGSIRDAIEGKPRVNQQLMSERSRGSRHRPVRAGARPGRTW